MAGEVVALCATTSPVSLRSASRADRFGLRLLPNGAWQGNVRSLEQPQRLGLLLVGPSLGG